MTATELMHLLNSFERATTNAAFYTYLNPLLSKSELEKAKYYREKLVEAILELDNLNNKEVEQN